MVTSPALLQRGSDNNNRRQLEAEVSIRAASDGKVCAGLHIIELVSAVAGRWGGQGCLPCKATPSSSTLLSSSGTFTTQTALEAVVGAGG